MNNLDQTRADIAEHGYVMQIDQTEEGHVYLYSIGLQRSLDHPDLIMFGLPQTNLFLVVRELVEKIRGGGRLAHGLQIDDVTVCPLQLRSVEPTLAAGYVARALEFYGADTPPRAQHELDMLQIVLPDKAGRFPWETEFDGAMARPQLHLWRAVH